MTRPPGMLVGDNDIGKPLPLSFQPGPFDVICARGKAARDHTGNNRFRVTIDMNLGRYRNSATKISKSVIVSEVVDSIRAASPGCGFVRFENGRWYVVGDSHAREKVGQSFRDRLHTEYRSSSRAKSKKRKLSVPNNNDLMMAGRAKPFESPPPSCLSTRSVNDDHDNDVKPAAQEKRHRNDSHSKGGINRGGANNPQRRTTTAVQKNDRWESKASAHDILYGDISSIQPAPLIRGGNNSALLFPETITSEQQDEEVALTFADNKTERS